MTIGYWLLAIGYWVLMGIGSIYLHQHNVCCTVSTIHSIVPALVFRVDFVARYELVS